MGLLRVGTDGVRTPPSSGRPGGRRAVLRSWLERELRPPTCRANEPQDTVVVKGERQSAQLPSSRLRPVATEAFARAVRTTPFMTSSVATRRSRGDASALSEEAIRAVSILA